jgi:cytochrome c peroxidase
MALLCQPSVDLDPAVIAFARAASPVPPPPAEPTNALADNPTAATLGHMLFFDPALSGRRDTSCATCHDPALAFTDGRAVAEAAGSGSFNTPTVLGAAHHRWLFWDGRADSLWSQALGPIENPIEMDGSRLDAVRHVAETPPLRSLYESIAGPMPDISDTVRFPSGARPGTSSWEAMHPADRQTIDTAFATLGKAIAAYERLLQPGESDFDRWVAAVNAGTRDDDILGEPAVRGLALFAGAAGCRQCHFGPTLSDLEFHDLSLPPADDATPHPGRGAGYPLLRASAFRADGPHSDAPESRKARRTAAIRIGTEHWGAFKTPSLRNVAATPPYMHAGNFETLTDVLTFYNTLEQQVRRHHHAEDVLRPLDFSPAQLADLEAFLSALTGDPPSTLLRSPPPETGIQNPETHE